MYNSNPYGFNGYRANGGRMWGMSQGVSNGMSRYAYSAQDNEYNVTPQTMQAPMSTRRDGAYTYSTFISNIDPNGSANNTSVAGDGGNGGNGGNSGRNSTTTTQVVRADGTYPLTNLIVNYLPQDMQDQELYALFRTAGYINTCRIMRDYKSGYSYGYAFVEYGSECDSLKAIKTLNGLNIRNKRIKVSYARPGGDAIKDTNLYVTNLPHTITDEQLETIFEKFGSIVQKNILRDKLTGKARGVAFVRFNKREEAQAAIDSLQNFTPQGAIQPIGVRLAEEHGKAKAAQYIQNAQIAAAAAAASTASSSMASGISSAYYNNMVHRGRPTKRFQKEEGVEFQLYSSNMPYGYYIPEMENDSGIIPPSPPSTEDQMEIFMSEFADLKSKFDAMAISVEKLKEDNLLIKGQLEQLKLEMSTEKDVKNNRNMNMSVEYMYAKVNSHPH